MKRVMGKKEFLAIPTKVWVFLSIRYYQKYRFSKSILGALIPT